MVKSVKASAGDDPRGSGSVSRRNFLQSAATVAGAAALPLGTALQAAPTTTAAAAAGVPAMAVPSTLHAGAALLGGGSDRGT